MTADCELFPRPRSHQEPLSPFVGHLGRLREFGDQVSSSGTIGIGTVFVHDRLLRQYQRRRGESDSGDRKNSDNEHLYRATIRDAL